MTNNDTQSIRISKPFLRSGVVALSCAAVLAGSGASAVASAAAAAPTVAPSTSTVSHNDLSQGGSSRSVLGPAAKKVVAAGAVGYLAHVRDGKRVHTAKAGLADLEKKRPIGVNDQFEVGSNTKTFTSVVVLQLVAQGKLSLDDTIEKHLPGVIPGGDKISVRQILNHTSGIFNYTADRPLMDKVESGSQGELTPMDLIQVAIRHEPDFAPGKGWNYSNTNYILAGLIAEKVAGQPMTTLIDRRIVRPLGLKHTYLVTDRVNYDGPGVAHGYYGDFSGDEPTYTDVTNWSLNWAGAAGAVMSTPSDLATFFQAVLGGRLVPAKQMNEMRTFVATPPAWQDLGVEGYGLGLIKYKTACGPVVGHGGDTNGHHSTAVGTLDGRRVAITDTTTQPRADTPNAQKLIAASASATTAAACLMLGKPVPAGS